ncbi:hypothetical protein ACCC93_08470, partial [Herbaspirillum frisingense]
MKTTLEIMRASPVIPVIAIDKFEHAVPLARALVAGGIRVLEITLRTEHGLPAIRAIAESVPDAIVGVGTLTAPEEFAASRDAGAVFGVSPGLTTSAMIASILANDAQHKLFRSGVPTEAYSAPPIHTNAASL